MISQIEAADVQMRRSGLAADWFAAVDAGVFGVAGSANGELFEQLATVTAFRDTGAVECLRLGGLYCLRLFPCVLWVGGSVQVPPWLEPLSPVVSGKRSILAPSSRQTICGSGAVQAMKSCWGS